MSYPISATKLVLNVKTLFGLQETVSPKNRSEEMQNQNPLSLVFTVKPVFCRESYENVDFNFFQGCGNFHWPKIRILGQQQASGPSLYHPIKSKGRKVALKSIVL